MTQEEAIIFTDEIKAFQEGKTIQQFNKFTNKWIDTMDPMFNHEHLYRIKPEEKQEQKRIIELSDDGETWFEATRFIPKCEKLHIRVRVETQPTKRLPTIEEVEKWYLENKVFVYKDDKAIVRICVISRYSETPIWTTTDDGFTISQFCEQLTHYDGTELYITD